ncbi:hypothetical protein JT358_11405 [Micrococcales bacterium 31B]|nr:hypothetical protein [Micrococcales bacterium 31B]
MLIAVILACEVMFWVFLVAGLVARYLMRKQRLGGILLALAPTVDLVLITVTALDLRSGANASFAHILSALYIGVSVAYGHDMVRWLDQRFARKYAGGPAPLELFGADYARLCWRRVVKTTLAMGIATAILLALSWIAVNPAQVEVLQSKFGILALVVGIEVFVAVGYTIWPRRAKVAAAA